MCDEHWDSLPCTYDTSRIQAFGSVANCENVVFHKAQGFLLALDFHHSFAKYLTSAVLQCYEMLNFSRFLAVFPATSVFRHYEAILIALEQRWFMFPFLYCLYHGSHIITPLCRV